jgi:predicted GH43/DUF377 family glycosyl hydrolase
MLTTHLRCRRQLVEKHVTNLFPKGWMPILLAAMFYAAPAFSQTVWTKHLFPVLDVGSPGSWDDQWAMPIESFGCRTHSGCGTPAGRVPLASSGSATHGRPINGLSWTKHPSPVITPTQAWETQYVWQPYVIRDSSLYKMWYNGGSGGGAGGIGYAWSTNGIEWTKYAGNPVVSPGPSTWDAENIEVPCVLTDGTSGFKMWYEGVPFGLDTVRVGYATATSETTWTKANNINPLLSPTPGTWEPTWLRSPRVLFNGVTYQMWYSAGPPYNTNNRGIGYATSLDGIGWERSSANPVLQSTPGTWDAGGIWAGDVLFDGTTYHLWYQAGSLTALRTGYASAPVDPTSVREVPGELPGGFALDQNYPNPFNPATTIKYALPVESNVRLRVYNILGQEVASLVNETQRAASGMASGVYFYRLQSKDFVETKKLILLR